jgi:hypothetical protein
MSKSFWLGLANKDDAEGPQLYKKLVTTIF